MITAFIFRCNGCHRRMLLNGHNLNDVTKRLVHEKHWKIGWDDSGSTHHCKKCRKAVDAKQKKEAEEAQKIRDKFTRAVHKKSKKVRDKRAERSEQHTKDYMKVAHAIMKMKKHRKPRR